MLDLFYQGGPLFMGILTLFLIAIIVLGVRGFVNGSPSETAFTKSISVIKELGIMALVAGILGQLIGFFSAFSMIESAGEVSQGVLAGGLKVSLITTIYGMIIFLISRIITSALIRRS